MMDHHVKLVMNSTPKIPQKFVNSSSNVRMEMETVKLAMVIKSTVTFV